jgi:hypothetical protein
MNKENTFTSTGIKLIHHPEVLKKLKSGFATPISLQVAPTSRCNLNCVFCSNVNRSKNESLEFQDIVSLLSEMCRHGLKTVEWTGGGDPTLYDGINECISFAHGLGLKQGLITNGINLKKAVSRRSLGRLTWIRVSMNCLDYVDHIDIPEFSNTLGFSYVWNTKTTDDVLSKLKQAVDVYHPKYVRIVPDCQASLDEHLSNNETLSVKVKSIGGAFFYQAKEFDTPKRCYWGYLKPFVLHDGHAYRCSSVVLNDTSDRSFHEKFRWCSIKNLPLKYASPMEHFVPKDCDRCVFSRQNAMVDSTLHPNGMEDFI